MPHGEVGLAVEEQLPRRAGPTAADARGEADPATGREHDTTSVRKVDRRSLPESRGDLAHRHGSSRLPQPGEQHSPADDQYRRSCRCREKPGRRAERPRARLTRLYERWLGERPLHAGRNPPPQHVVRVELGQRAWAPDLPERVGELSVSGVGGNPAFDLRRFRGTQFAAQVASEGQGVDVVPVVHTGKTGGGLADPYELLGVSRARRPSVGAER